MSGRSASTTHPKFRPARLVFAGALVVLGGVVCGCAAAQPPAPPPKDEAKQTPPSPSPTKEEDIAKGAAKVDTNNPVPADALGRSPHAKYRLETDKRIFNRVVDFKPVASEAENSDEYQAWVAVVMHAHDRKFSTAELERAGAADLTPIDLLKPHRSLFRYELLRFDGKLVCIRRLEAPLFFKDNPQLGIKELYEARFVPVDESPLTPVSIVFTELPEALADVAQKPYREWVDRDVWISAAGFFFKTMSVPGEQGNAVVGVPVLVGRSVTVIPGPPAAYGDPTALDRTARVYKFIRDKTKIAGRPRLNDFDTPWEESAAYDRVVRHAARFTAEELEQHARGDLKFADLFQDESAPGYRLQLIKFDGRLISLRRFDPGAEVKAAGIEHMFEGWLVPANEPRGNPVCIVFTEPLAGVEANGRVNKWVSFAGYFFKKMCYKSAEPDPKNPARNLDKYAPLLIGKCPIARHDPDEPTSLSWGVFVQGAIVGGVLLIAAAGVLAWYYRRGDRKAKSEMAAVRNRNPFDPSANLPPTAAVSPGSLDRPL